MSRDKEGTGADRPARTDRASSAGDPCEARGTEPPERGWIWAALALVLGIVGGYGAAMLDLREQRAAVAPPTIEAPASAAQRDAPIFSVPRSTDTSPVPIAAPQPAPFLEHTRLSAIIRETPGVSDINVSARAEGVLRQWLAAPGQALRPGDAIAELEVTGDGLIKTQASLLYALQRVAAVNAELEPLGDSPEDVDSRRQLKQELRKLTAQVATTREELALRGLSAEQIDGIQQSGSLLRRMILKAPRLPQDDNASPSDDLWVYTVDSLQTTVGSWLSAGAPVARLAHHSTLALEARVPAEQAKLLADVVERRRPLQVELGPERRPIELPIGYIDAKVDATSQTTGLFLPLLNEVDSEIVKEGSRFRIWRFKPGQRGEVLLPGRRWMEEIPLPRGAVANDEGVRYVFRHVATRQSGDATVDDFAPQRVTVLYEDADTTLIPASSLPAGSSIAMGQADRLLRWLKGRPDH